MPSPPRSPSAPTAGGSPPPPPRPPPPPDGGGAAPPPLGRRRGPGAQAPPLEDWIGVVQSYGALQRALGDHADLVLATGVPTFPEHPDAVLAWLDGLVAASRALPDADPRRLDDAEASAVAQGRGRIRDAAERLVAAGIPRSLQHNDLHLGNTFRRGNGAVAFIDLGDALWTHPLTAARIPLWILRRRFDLDPDSTPVRRAVDAYLEPW